jgi:hypothetical protein
MEYPFKYVGQNEGTLTSKICFKNIKAIKANKQNPKYVQHILDKGHTYGTVTETLEILYTEKKGHFIDTQEIFHTYLSIYLWLYSPLLDLGRFFSFLILYTVGRTP